jgi:hypothetical protein
LSIDMCFVTDASQMNSALGLAQSDDIKSLYKVGLNYIVSLQPNRTLIPNILANSPKHEYYGWKHPVCVDLLCPVDYLAAYQADLVE